MRHEALGRCKRCSGTLLGVEKRLHKSSSLIGMCQRCRDFIVAIENERNDISYRTKRKGN